MWHYASLLRVPLLALLLLLPLLNIRFICAFSVSRLVGTFQFFAALSHFSPCPHCPQIVRRRDAFLIASDGKREVERGGGSTCTCCRCQFSNWTFVINFNGSVVQSSLAHFSQCTPGVNSAGQDFHSDPLLRFTVLCFALLLLMQLCYLCGIVSFFVAAFDACLLLLALRLLLLLLLPVARSHLLLLLSAN